MRPTIIILFASILTGCGAEIGAPTYADQDIQWGASVNGLQVGIARRDYQPGTGPTGKGIQTYTIRLRNTGNKEIKVLWPTKPEFGTPVLPLDGKESVAIQFAYETAGGVKVADFKPPNKPILYPLLPGAQHGFELQIVAGKFGLNQFQPGTMTASYRNQQSSIDYGSAAEGIVTDLWMGAATSGAVKVEGVSASTKPVSVIGRQPDYASIIGLSVDWPQIQAESTTP